MIKIFILYVVTTVHSGVVVTTQEFTSEKQCNYVKSWVLETSAYIRAANCFEK